MLLSGFIGIVSNICVYGLYLFIYLFTAIKTVEFSTVCY